MERLPVLLHSPQSPGSSLNQWICSEGLLPTKEDDILKQSQAFLRKRWLSSSSCSDSWPMTMETAIFVKIHSKKWLFLLPRGAIKLLELSKSCSNRFGGKLARSISACISQLSWEEFSKFSFGKWQPLEFWLFLSLRKLESWNAWWVSAFQCTTYWSQFQMWTFHSVLNATLSIGFGNGLSVSIIRLFNYLQYGKYRFEQIQAATIK